MQLPFKAGTFFSKSWDMIDRFSVDIDLVPVRDQEPRIAERSAVFSWPNSLVLKVPFNPINVFAFNKLDNVIAFVNQASDQVQ